MHVFGKTLSQDIVDHNEIASYAFTTVTDEMYHSLIYGWHRVRKKIGGESLGPRMLKDMLQVAIAFLNTKDWPMDPPNEEQRIAHEAATTCYYCSSMFNDTDGGKNAPTTITILVNIVAQRAALATVECTTGRITTSIISSELASNNVDLRQEKRKRGKAKLRSKICVSMLLQRLHKKIYRLRSVLCDL